MRSVVFTPQVQGAAKKGGAGRLEVLALGQRRQRGGDTTSNKKTQDVAPAATTKPPKTPKVR